MVSPKSPDISKTPSGLRRVIAFLFGPSSRLTDTDERRRSLFLSVLIVVMLLIFGAVDTVKSITTTDYRVVWYGYPFMAAALALNRRGFFALGSWIVLLMFPVVIFASQLLGWAGSGPNTLSYLVLGIMLASLLRNSRETVFYAGLNLIFILLLPWMTKYRIGWHPVITPLAINGIGTALTLMINYYRDLLERDRQKELREGRSKYQELVETTNDWTWEVDCNAVFTYAAPQVEKILGYSPDEIVGRTIFSIMPPADAERVKEIFRENSKQPAAFTGLIGKCLHKNSQLITLETSGTPVFDANGIHAGYRGINRDVSEREQLSLELTQTASLLETVLDSIPDVIRIMDLDHNVIRYNTAGREFWSSTEVRDPCGKCHELLGRSKPCTECTTAEAIRTGKSTRVERYLGKKDIWVDMRSYPVKDPSGETTLVIEHLRDITERMKTSEVVRREHDFRQAIIETAVEGIGVCQFIDEAPRVRFSVWNQKMEKITGYTMEEINKLGWLQALYPDVERRKDAGKRLESIANGGHLKGAEREIIRADGEPRVISIYTADLSVPGRPHQVLSMVQDVTERRQAEDAKRESEERLRQAEKLEAIGLLAGGIAHDFNNQLSGILGFADILHADLEGRPDLRDCAKQIITAADRSAKLTQQLLSFARKGKLHHVPVQVHEIIEEALSILSHSIDKRITLEQSLTTDSTVTMGDPAQLQSAMLNVAINARDAMPNGGVIKFTTSLITLKAEPESRLPLPSSARPGDFIQISIKDNGMGMDEELLNRVFEPFFTTKEPTKGTGLGLSAAYGIVDAHSGFIQVDSAPDQGTEFRIFLPAVTKTDIPATNTAKIRRGRQDKLRVMVIDDEPVAANMCGKMLSRLGHDPLVYLDCDEAIEVYASDWQMIDLVVLDMIMPKKNGTEVFQALQKTNPDVCVIVCSGFTMDGEAQGLIDAGACSFVQKPYKMATLSQAMDQAIAD